jgi:hypothetical protein
VDRLEGAAFLQLQKTDSRYHKLLQFPKAICHNGKMQRCLALELI